ncbi:MAG: hypothetical protein M3170_03940 [Candidatus Dormibacteraeota bacterium]|nr:hypothetical protein [Candidatus Dormibacteraeota bacterium]
MSARPGDAHAFIAEVREGMERLNVYRGQTISLSAAPLQVGPGPVTLIQFESLPQVSREAVVQPEGCLGESNARRSHSRPTLASCWPPAALSSGACFSMASPGREDAHRSTN